MTDDLLRKFAELNPVADPDRLIALEPSEPPADPFLRALLEHPPTNGDRPDRMRSAHDRNTGSAHTRGTRRNGDMQTTKVRPDQQPTTHRRPRTLAAVGAAAAVILAVIAGLIVINDRDQAAVVSGNADAEVMTDLEIVEAGVAALYSGDADRAVELFGIEDGDDEAQIRADDLIRREAVFQAAIGGRLTLNCTEEVNTPGMFTCNVPYHNALTDAVGYVDSPGDFIHVVVQDGVITQFGLPQHLVQGIAHEFPEHNDLLRTVVSFLREEVEGSEGCRDDPTSLWAVIRTPECTRLIMDHLVEWAAWYRTNG